MIIKDGLDVVDLTLYDVKNIIFYTKLWPTDSADKSPDQMALHMISNHQIPYYFWLRHHETCLHSPLLHATIAITSILEKLIIYEGVTLHTRK